MKRRRSAGPSFTIERSSGANITTFSIPISSPEREAICRSMNIFLRSPSRSFISIRWEPVLLVSSAPTYPPAQPRIISSASREVLWDLPKAQRKTASTLLVFPSALSPTMAFMPGPGRRSSAA